MTNRIALVLGVLIICALAFDAWQNDAINIVYLARKLSAFIEWIAFWR